MKKEIEMEKLSLSLPASIPSLWLIAGHGGRMVLMSLKRFFMARERAAGLGGFWGFASAVIGMVAGADRFIGLDGAGPKEPAAPKTTARPHCDPDVNQPEGPDQ